MPERRHEDMTRRPSLFATKEPATEVVEIPTPVTVDVPASRSSKPRPPSRTGKRVLSVYLDPIAWKQLRQIALDADTSMQALGEEAINLLFQKHRLNRSA
jgi:hypothetical protein